MAKLPFLNRWEVLTGAPCSGKTAVIEALSRRGYRTVPETARAHVASQLAKGIPLAEIRRDRLAFERAILKDKVALEQDLPPESLIFFDRGIPDSIAYYRLSGLDPSEPLEYAKKSAYHTVFLLDRLPIREDDVRKEGEETAGTIERLLVESYEGLGYRLIRIPVLPVPERTDLILQHLE